MSFETIRLRLANPAQAHAVILDLWSRIKPALMCGQILSFEVKPETRSTEQNRLFWSCLNDISRQVEWPVDGQMQKLSAEEWKHVFSAALKKHQRAAKGLEGGFVILGQQTSKYTRAEMTEQIDLVHAFGDDKSVQWSPTSLGREWAMEETCSS